jgi:hypothetical protein
MRTPGDLASAGRSRRSCASPADSASPAGGSARCRPSAPSKSLRIATLMMSSLALDRKPRVPRATNANEPSANRTGRHLKTSAICSSCRRKDPWHRRLSRRLLPKRYDWPLGQSNRRGRMDDRLTEPAEDESGSGGGMAKQTGALSNKLHPLPSGSSVAPAGGMQAEGLALLSGTPGGLCLAGACPQAWRVCPATRPREPGRLCTRRYATDLWPRGSDRIRLRICLLLLPRIEE